MWAPERHERIHAEIGTCLDDLASDECPLRNANDVDLFACEVVVVLEFVAHDVRLPPHVIEDS